jgi:hypothetical protein
VVDTRGGCVVGISSETIDQLIGRTQDMSHRCDIEAMWAGADNITSQAPCRVIGLDRSVQVGFVAEQVVDNKPPLIGSLGDGMAIQHRAGQPDIVHMVR